VDVVDGSAHDADDRRREERVPVVRFERTFAHPVQAVWAAVTDPDALEQWFPTTVWWGQLRPGAPIEFRFPTDRYPPMSGEVIAVEPERRLVFTWGEDRLTFQLEPRERHLLPPDVLGGSRQPRQGRA
jgi:uncharacterized protein YndB with AHSA1/START domain